MNVQNSKQDEFEEELRKALTKGPAPGTEERLTGMVRDFRIRLKQHPDVVRARVVPAPAPRRSPAALLKWMAAAIVLFGGVGLGAFLLLPALAHRQAASEPVRPGEGVGAIRLGMTAGEVRQAWGEPDEVVGGTAYNYYARGVQLTVAAEGGVNQIACTLASVLAEQFGTFAGKTPEGIGIGSTEAQVRRALGEPERRIETPVPGSAGPALVQLAYRNGLTVVLDAAPAQPWVVRNNIAPMPDLPRSAAKGERRVVALRLAAPQPASAPGK